MTNCPNPNCNTKNLPDDARFCPNCGTEILPPIMVVKSCKFTPKSVKLGDECKIQWQGDFVQHVVIEGVKYTQKSIALQPKHSQTLAVTFVGLDGSTLTKEVNISVVVPQPDIQITAPEYANPNDKVLINWDAKYVDKVTIGNKSFKAKDKVSLVHENGKTICEILFHGIDGSVVPKIVKVRKALPANVESCILEPEYISERESIVVKWKGSNIVKWKLKGEQYRSSVIKSCILFTSDKDIKVSFQGEDGKVIEKTLTPKIFKVNFCKVDHRKIVLGESVIISWDAQHTKSVTIFGKKQPEKGSYTWTPTEMGIVACPIEFVGKNGSKKEEKLTLKVVPEPQIVRFEIEGDKIVLETISMQGGTINGNDIGDVHLRKLNIDKFLYEGKLVFDCWDWREKHYTKEISPQILQFEWNGKSFVWRTIGCVKWSINGVDLDRYDSPLDIDDCIEMGIDAGQPLTLTCIDPEGNCYSKTISGIDPQILSFKAKYLGSLSHECELSWTTIGMKWVKILETEKELFGVIKVQSNPIYKIECCDYNDVHHYRTIDFIDEFKKYEEYEFRARAFNEYASEYKSFKTIMMIKVTILVILSIIVTLGLTGFLIAWWHDKSITEYEQQLINKYTKQLRQKVK